MCLNPLKRRLTLFADARVSIDLIDARATIHTGVALTFNDLLLADDPSEPRGTATRPIPAVRAQLHLAAPRGHVVGRALEIENAVGDIDHEIANVAVVAGVAWKAEFAVGDGIAVEMAFAGVGWHAGTESGCHGTLRGYGGVGYFSSRNTGRRCFGRHNSGFLPLGRRGNSCIHSTWTGSLGRWSGRAGSRRRDNRSAGSLRCHDRRRSDRRVGSFACLHSGDHSGRLLGAWGCHGCDDCGW